jgi:hypothetical protein
VLMQVDGGPAAAGDSVAGLSGSAEARGHVFSALAQLTQRLPDLFQVRGVLFYAGCCMCSAMRDLFVQSCTVRGALCAGLCARVAGRAVSCSTWRWSASATAATADVTSAVDSAACVVAAAAV